MFTNSTILDDSTSTFLADLFSALSDPSRLRIISTLLQNERSVGDIAATLEMSQSAVSHQLRGLRHMRLVKARKSGRQMYYRLDDDHVEKLFQMGLDHVLYG